MAATSFRDHLRHRGLRGGTRIIVPCCSGTNSPLQMATISECRYRWLRVCDLNLRLIDGMRESS